MLNILQIKKNIVSNLNLSCYSLTAHSKIYSLAQPLTQRGRQCSLPGSPTGKDEQKKLLCSHCFKVILYFTNISAVLYFVFVI